MGTRTGSNNNAPPNPAEPDTSAAAKDAIKRNR